MRRCVRAGLLLQGFPGTEDDLTRTEGIPWTTNVEVIDGADCFASRSMHAGILIGSLSSRSAGAVASAPRARRLIELGRLRVFAAVLGVRADEAQRGCAKKRAAP